MLKDVFLFARGHEEESVNRIVHFQTLVSDLATSASHCWLGFGSDVDLTVAAAVMREPLHLACVIALFLSLDRFLIILAIVIFFLVFSVDFVTSIVAVVLTFGGQSRATDLAAVIPQSQLIDSVADLWGQLC